MLECSADYSLGRCGIDAHPEVVAAKSHSRNHEAAVAEMAIGHVSHTGLRSDSKGVACAIEFGDIGCGGDEKEFVTAE